MPTMLRLTPCEQLSLASSYQGRSRSYQRAGLCLSDRAQGMEMLLISICLAFLFLFLPQNQCKGSFSTRLHVKGGGGRGEMMEKYSADEKLFTQFFLPAASIYRFN